MPFGITLAQSGFITFGIFVTFFRGIVMKKNQAVAALLLALGSIFGISTAHADTIRLGAIYTAHCYADQSEVQLLSSFNTQVRAYCEAGGYIAPNGVYYPYKMTTTVHVPYVVTPGTQIRLASIDTNRCDRAQSLVALLNSPEVTVDTGCEAGTFLGHNGHYYSFRLNTLITVNR
jgi:hypothetical protein